MRFHRLPKSVQHNWLLKLFDPADRKVLTELWHKLRRMRPRQRRRFRWEGGCRGEARGRWAEEWDEVALRASYFNLDRRRGGGVRVLMEITSSGDEVEIVEPSEAEAKVKVKTEVSCDAEVDHEVPAQAKATIKRS